MIRAFRGGIRFLVGSEGEMLEIAQGLTHTCLPTQAESTNLEVLGPTHGLQESSGTAKYRMRCVRACVRACASVSFYGREMHSNYLCWCSSFKMHKTFNV